MGIVSATWLGVCFSAVAMAACREPATESLCQRAVQHMVEQLYSEVDGARRQTLGGEGLRQMARATLEETLAECQSRWTRGRAQCVLAARSRQKIRECPAP